MNTYNTQRAIGYVRLSNIENDEFSKEYQNRLLDSYGVDEIFTDNSVCLKSQTVVAERLDELGILPKLITNSRLVIVSVSRLVFNDKQLDAFLEYCKLARIRLVVLKQGINTGDKFEEDLETGEEVEKFTSRFTYLESLRMRKEQYAFGREEIRRASVMGVDNNGNPGLSSLKCWFVAQALQKPGVTKAEVARQLGIRREWIYQHKLHLPKTQQRWLNLTEGELKGGDPLLKRQILKELGF